MPNILLQKSFVTGKNLPGLANLAGFANIFLNVYISPKGMKDSANRKSIASLILDSPFYNS
jgi:hypothetical protein